MVGRHDLLTIVRKHSNLLGQIITDEQASSDSEMDERFWYEMLDMYFIHGREPKGCHEDDLVFFVRLMVLSSDIFSTEYLRISSHFL